MENGKADEGPAKRRGGAQAVAERSAEFVFFKVSGTKDLELANRKARVKKSSRGSVLESLEAFRIERGC